MYLKNNEENTCGTGLGESCGTRSGHTCHPEYLLPTVQTDNIGKINGIALKYVLPTPLELYTKTPQSKGFA